MSNLASLKEAPHARATRLELVLPEIVVTVREIRAYPTVLVPRASSGPDATCPWCHEPHGTLYSCCRWRPDNHEPLLGTCERCVRPLADHGVHGIAYCGQCGGTVQIPTGDVVGHAKYNDGGPDNAAWAWLDYNDNGWMQENHPEWVAWLERHRELYGKPQRTAADGYQAVD